MKKPKKKSKRQQHILNRWFAARKSKVLMLVTVGAVAVVGVALTFTSQAQGFSCATSLVNGAEQQQQSEPVAKQETKAQLSKTGSQLFENTYLRQKAAGGKKSSFDPAIQQLAQTRKDSLTKVMYQNPDQAWDSLFRDDLNSDLQQLTNNCVEQPVTVEGDLEVWHQDTFTEKPSVTQYFLKNKKEKIQIHPARTQDSKVNLTSGVRLKIKGYRLDNNLLFDASSPGDVTTVSRGGLFDTPKAYAAVPDSIGEQKTIVLMANFSNNPAPPLAKEEVNDVVFNQVNSFYREASYGKTSITGTTVGWFDMPITSSCDEVAVREEAVRAADASVDFRNYKRLIIVSPFSPNCANGFRGGGTLGNTVVRTDDGAISMSVASIPVWYFNFSVVAHELGHNLGLRHASGIDCQGVPIADSGCVISEYGDIADVMGGFGLRAHFNSSLKDYLGWFNPGNIKTITTSGNYVLEPYETTTSGLYAPRKALKIQRKESEYLYLEYRQPIGKDADIPPEEFKGALLHTTSGNLNRSVLLDSSPGVSPPKGIPSSYALMSGSTFKDPASGAIINVISKTAAGLIVNITLGKSDFTPPEVHITSPLQQGSTPFSGIVPFSATASDSSGIEKVEFYAGKSTTPIYTDFEAPYTTTLDTTTLPNGNTGLYAVAYDRSGQAFNATNNTRFDKTGISVYNAPR